MIDSLTLAGMKREISDIIQDDCHVYDDGKRAAAEARMDRAYGLMSGAMLMMRQAKVEMQKADEILNGKD